jgi:hypothetical protein
VFFMFLAVVCAVTLVRTGMLAWTLYPWPGRTRVGPGGVGGGRVDADRVARSALAGALGGIRAGDAGVGERMLPLADARFAYRWHIAHARVIATARLSRITVLVSVLVVCFGAGPTFFLAHFESHGGLYGDWVAAVTLLSTRLAIGLAVAIMLSGVAMFFEGRLIRRNASWLVYRATVATATAEE